MLLDNPVLLQLKRQSEEARKAAGLPPLKYEEDESNGNKDESSRKRNEGRRANGGERHNKDSRKNNSAAYAYGNMKEGLVKTTDKGYGFLEVDLKESYFIKFFI